jgi:hypothetical protein
MDQRSIEEERAAQKKAPSNEEPFISRQEAASLLCISLVTLTDWMKKVCLFINQGEGFTFCAQKS